MGEDSDEEFLQALLSNHQQPSRCEDSDEEFLQDLLSSHRQPSRCEDSDEEFLQDLLSSHRHPSRRKDSDEEFLKEPKTKRGRTGDEKPTTPMTSTPTTKNQPTISGRTDVARQLDVPVPMGVLWDVCSFNAWLTVKTVVKLVKQRIQIRLVQFKPACFKIGIASDPICRFHDGYVKEGYAFMEVLWRSTPAKCVAVETDSVDLFIGTVGCHNATRGGGGVDATREDYQQHVYVVFSPISFLVKFRLERVRSLAATVQRTGYLGVSASRHLSGD